MKINMLVALCLLTVVLGVQATDMAGAGGGGVGAGGGGVGAECRAGVGLNPKFSELESWFASLADIPGVCVCMICVGRYREMQKIPRWDGDKPGAGLRTKEEKQISDYYEAMEGKEGPFFGGRAKFNRLIGMWEQPHVKEKSKTRLWGRPAQ